MGGWMNMGERMDKRVDDCGGWWGGAKGLNEDERLVG